MNELATRLSTYCCCDLLLDASEVNPHHDDGSKREHRSIPKFIAEQNINKTEKRMSLSLEAKRILIAYSEGGDESSTSILDTVFDTLVL